MSLEDSGGLVRVAVVVPVHNRRETTLNGLRSLGKADREGLIVTTIVVDDGSTDGTSEAIQDEFPEVIVVSGDGDLFYSAGTNLAISVALRSDPDFVVAMNDDAEFDPSFLRALVACAQRVPNAVVGALLTQDGRPGFAFQVGAVWSTLYGGWKIPQDLAIASLPEGPFEVDVLVGNCVLVPTEAILRVGLQNAARFPIGFGDAEWSLRLRKAGWRQVVEPRAQVRCEPNTNPTPLRIRGFRGAIEALVGNRMHPLNLRRQWVNLTSSAPRPFLGPLAFACWCFHMTMKAVGVGSWPNWGDPTPARYIAVVKVAGNGQATLID